MVRSAGRKRKSHGGVRLNALQTDVIDPANKALSPTKLQRRSSKLTVEQERLLSSFDMAYNELPSELMTGHDLDLSMWTLVVHDSCLAKMAVAQSQKGWASISNQTLDEPTTSLASLLPDVAKSRSSPSKPISTAVKLNLRGAEHITDNGMRQIISSLGPRLQALNLSRTIQLTDTLVRWIATTCKNLREIDVSYMPHLGSIGVSAIGECCQSLEVFSMAGCTKVAEFALLKIAHGCPSLLEFELSHCSQVRDNFTRAIAANCTQLKRLGIRSCNDISDTGIIALANGCFDLHHIDLSRTDFQYKITDMALLGLSEKCKVLQQVNLSGCDYLTDAGLAWLAGGCPALTNINIAHCSKLTDFSLRAIAEGCIRLEVLDVSHCPRMSDVGLRYISVGCRDLTTFRLKNVIMVSDGTCHGSEHLQGLASLSQGCKQIQHLDLAKCHRVDDVACRQIGRGFHDLRTLCLQQCAKITSDGVQEIGRHCPKLTHVDFTGCHLINDNALSAIGAGVHLLQSLKLRDCVNISTAGIKRLCHGCTNLRTLDLAGCQKIDDMALLAMSDCLFELQHLWLSGLPNITIIGVSWLADRCTKLMHLDVSNSSISYTSLKPLRGAWKYGELHERNKTCGIFPKYRAEDILFLDFYGACWKAVIRIQCLYRARVARREAAQRRELALIHWAASKMQSIYRGRQARRYAMVQRMQRRRKEEAAMMIQAAFRAYLARRLAARLRLQRERERYIQMVIKVQSAWRQKIARDIFNSKRLLKLAWEQKREASAKIIQRGYRSYTWRKCNFLYLTAMRLKREQEQAAANKLQTLYRGRAARLEAQRKREALRLFQMQKEKAANCLQRVIRRRRERRIQRRRLQREAELETTAIRIQKRYRLRRQMLSYQLMKLGREFQQQTAAALRLQAAWRRKQGHLAKHMLRILKDEEYQRRVKAATKLQTRWRGRLGRALAAQAQIDAIHRLAMEAKRRNELATRIQAGWRGMKGRRRYNEALNIRKRRWKEVPNTETGKKVYYHQDTGEIRYRMPQDLLDILPKPRCNDYVADAMVECGDCGEFFCKECWDAIHAGGRRRKHRFRTLYDFYDKRIDYGDGEFPSVWPSEIEQDDLDGWFYRASPFREPCLVLGEWEKYVDDANHREWYFNPTTKVSTYLPPDAFKASAEDISLAWVQKRDSLNHATYYFNKKTGQRTFERPPKFVEDDVVEDASPIQDQPTMIVQEPTENVQGDGATILPVYGVDLGYGWTQYWDETYQTYYYYNTTTQELTYTPPDTLSGIAL
ncbi:hypothetical protein Ae201684P_006557 [Aphanomyces euteiches]|nr:hypothetical protein Ae201684P_006557 [Aphanomyces euteiches]